MTPFDWDPPTAKPIVALGAVALILVSAAGYQQHRVADARADAAVAQETARAAKQVQAQATQQAAQKGLLAEEWERTAGALQRRLDALPVDPGPRPVAPDATAALVLGEMRGMGLAPQPLADPLALGLMLPDGRTVITWGREAQRVGPLAARLETSIVLARALEGATGALHSQVSDLTTALGACDDRAAAEAKRADALDRALKATGRPRNWTAGLLVGVDTDAKKTMGAYVSWNYKAVDFHGVVIGNTVALGAGYRF